MSANNMSDPRRPNKVLRYKPPPSECNPALDDPTPDYMNLLGMIFSMCGLMLKVGMAAYLRPTARPGAGSERAEVVCLGCCLLLLHQLRQLPEL
ncbi:protein Asterix isoform X2 [Phyllostomus discolor]|uniref:PAT complex subunit Asterix n=1 Tax=Phyllostomus discolor TaxID=89673 RepID=A0A7E6EB90_9CHIR|nr:protein Asterix isoform X2 [Phyllostomus discolor]